VAYGDWPEEFQDIWNSIPADYSGMSVSELEMAEFMFEEGFMRYEDEKTAEDDISFARDQFFDMIGYDENWKDYFDWDGWREAMGYE
jgi:hypothetical protein